MTDETTDESPEPAADLGNPDHAWKLLTLINEWVRHADAKATVTLAFTGAMGALLFNIVKDLPETNCATDVVAVASGVALLASAVLCGMTLTPRVGGHPPFAKPVNEEVNRLFFGHISRHFSDQVEYRDVVRTLTETPGELIKDIADQIHANANIATAKHRNATRAIWAMLAAGFGIAVLAVIVAR